MFILEPHHRYLSSTSANDAVSLFYENYYKQGETPTYLVETIIRSYFSNNQSLCRRAVELLKNNLSTISLDAGDSNPLNSAKSFMQMIDQKPEGVLSPEEMKKFRQNHRHTYPYFWYALNEYTRYDDILFFIKIMSPISPYIAAVYNQCLVNGSDNVVAAIINSNILPSLKITTVDLSICAQVQTNSGIIVEDIIY